MSTEVNSSLEALLSRHVESATANTHMSEGFKATLQSFKQHRGNQNPITASVGTGSTAIATAVVEVAKPAAPVKRSFGRRDVGARAPTTAAKIGSSNTDARTTQPPVVPPGKAHWSTKPLDTMTHLDWLNFKETFSISIAAKNTPRATKVGLTASGASKQLLATNTAPHPLRCWGEILAISPKFPQWLLKALEDQFPFPTSIQMQSVAAASRVTSSEAGAQGTDVMAIAETGSGKTLAYVVSAFIHLARNEWLIPFDIESRRKGPRVLILVPNRELGIQVHHVLESLLGKGPTGKDGKPMLKAGVAVGGENADAQHQQISQGLHFLVASPGQANRLLTQSYLALGNSKCVIIDEADTMVDDGLSDQLVETLMACPPSEGSEGGRQTLLFTATMLPELERISSTYLAPSYYLVSTPYRFARTDQRFFLFQNKLKAVGRGQPDGNEEEVEEDEEEEEEEEAPMLHQGKIQQLIGIMQGGLPPTGDDVPPPEPATDPTPIQGPVMVFTNSKRTTERIERRLLAEEIATKALHGEMKQNERRSTIEAFRQWGQESTSSSAATVQVLVTTDMLARGLDVPNVELVVNFDMPRPEVADGDSQGVGEKGLVRYIHRIGRTARAGQAGAVCSFIALHRSLLVDALDDSGSDQDDDGDEEDGENERGKRGRDGDSSDDEKKGSWEKKEKKKKDKKKDVSKAAQRKREGERDDRQIIKPLLKMLRGCTHPSAKKEVEDGSELKEISKNLNGAGSYVGKALLH